jgi:hypothetical protein
MTPDTHGTGTRIIAGLALATGLWAASYPVWIFAWFPEHRATRLVSRNRVATPNASLPTHRFDQLLMEPGSLVMERKMLLEIKQRAERLAQEHSAAEVPAT